MGAPVKDASEAVLSRTKKCGIQIQPSPSRCVNHRGSKCAVTFGCDHHFVVTDCEVIFLKKVNEDVAANSCALSAQRNLIEVRKWFFGA